jgi:hypothetical protein
MNPVVLFQGVSFNGLVEITERLLQIDVADIHLVKKPQSIKGTRIPWGELKDLEEDFF